jgi:hypothetical protein
MPADVAVTRSRLKKWHPPPAPIASGERKAAAKRRWVRGSVMTKFIFETASRIIKGTSDQENKIISGFPPSRE